MMEQKKVAIIGAGISGLAACKFIISKGMVPIVLDARGVIGGVWNETLKSTVLQTPTHMFRFSDFPWSKSVTAEFPMHNQVLDYIKSYAEHFGLLKYIRLNSKVVSIEYEGFSDEEIEGWTHWGHSGNAFAKGSKWRLNVVDAQTNAPLQVSLMLFFIDYSSF